LFSFIAPASINASLYRESCFKTGPDGRKGIPYFRCAAKRVIPLPCVRSGFLADGHHKAGNEAGPTEKENL
jgi:hypothetical protein